MHSFISPESDFQIWSILAVVAAFCAIGERKRWFGNISGALMVILILALLSSTGLVPSASDQDISVPVYQFVFDYIIPIAIPLLLFNAGIKRIIKESGKLLGGFIFGSLGVALGALIAGWFLNLGPETYKVAGTFTGTYTGGSVNFLAVAATLDFLESPLFPATIAVDNVFTNLYIAFLFLLPSLSWLGQKFIQPEKELDTPPPVSNLTQEKELPLFEKLAMALAIASFITALGLWVSPHISTFLNTDINLDLLVITLLILIVANLFPQWLAKFENVAFDLGMLLMYLFLGVIGAATNLREMVTAAPEIILFALITLIVHLFTTILAGRLLGLSLQEIAIVSAANAGGPSTAAPMAATFNLKKAVTPAILIGVLGYVIGTFLGVGVGLLLR